MPKFEKVQLNFDEYRPSELFEIIAMGKNEFERIGCVKKSKSVKNNMLIKENKYRYTARFDNVEVKAHVLNKEEKEQEKTLLASIEPLTEFIPKIDFERNYDLLGVSCNLYTPGLGNKNFQAIGGRDGIELAKTFIGKQWNGDHNRKSVAGFITNVGFSTYPDNQPISEEEAYALADENKVFNVAIGGVVWRVIDEDLADLIEESSDPDSLNYMSISSSWEVAFNDYKVAMGSNIIADCKIIDDPDLISEIKDSLTVFGGKGKTKDGRPLYLLISGESLGLGAAFTKSPAASVSGVATLATMKTSESLDQKITSSFTDAQVSKINKIAQLAQKPYADIANKIEEEMSAGLTFEESVKEMVNDETIEESAMTKEKETQLAAAIEPAKFSTSEIGKINSYSQEYGKTTDEYCAQLIVFLCEGDDFEAAAAKTNDYFNKVSGVVTETSQYVAPLEQNENINASAEDLEKNQKSKSVINNNNNINNMFKFKDKDIADEKTLTEVIASEVETVKIETLAEAAKKYTDEVKAEKERAEKAEADLKAATEKLEQFQAKLAEIEAKQREVEAEAAFQNRMGYLNEEFELTDEARASILDDVKACADDESFQKFVSKLSVFAAKKKKVEEKMKDKKDEVDASEILASLKADEPKLPNKEVGTESTTELFSRVLSAAVKIS